MLRRGGRSAFAMIAVIVPLLSGVVLGQDAGLEPVAVPPSPLDGTIVGSINIEGLDTISEGYIRNQIQTRENEPFSQGQLQRDVGRLLRTGRFLDVKAETQLVDNQVELTLTFQEKPAVAGISFVGAQKFDAKELTKELQFAVGDPVDLFEVRQGREAIARKYKDKGYAYVEVTYDEDLLANERRVVYTIVENQRVRVRDISFDGNAAYSDGELAAEIDTKEYIWIFREGDFNPDRAERDAAKIQKYYRDRGYLDAEAGYVLEFEDVERERLHVIFRVNEGTRYSIRELRVEGNTVFDGDELLATMLLAEGDYLIDQRLQVDLKAIGTKYGKDGYIYASATAEPPVFTEEPGEVILTIRVREGEQYRVGWIEVNGNTRTQEKVVRRELDFYPGEIFDITKIRKAEKDLENTQLFGRPTIEFVGKEPGVRDVLVTVEENPNPNQFIAGVGAGSDSGVVGQFSLRNTNFDLFDWPRSWKEFMQGKAFRGAGQSLTFNLEPGTEFTRFRIDFSEPYLMDREIAFGTSLYLFERGRDGYDEERAGVNVSFGKAFEHGWLEGWASEIALRMEMIDVGDRQTWAAKSIREVEGGSYLSSVKLSLLHDTTDDPFLPADGHRFQVSYEQTGVLGGDYTFGKLTSSYSRFWEVYRDESDRKSIFSIRANIGQIVGDAPVFERFYAGGVGSLRGFDYRGVSPREGLRNNRVGGDFMLLTGAEYTFPLYDELIRGVFFTDMGTVEEGLSIESWRASVGFGVRLTLELFGGVPMEFDFGIPVSSDEEDDTRVFSFYIGLPFF